MGEQMLSEQIFQVAETLLLDGKEPQPALIAEQVGCELAAVEAVWSELWRNLPSRLLARESQVMLTEVPAVLNQAFVRIWQHALQEANARMALEKHQVDLGAEEARRSTDDAVRRAQSQVVESNERLRQEQERLAEANSQIKGLEAEIQVLKTNLGSETSLRKKEEQRRSNLEQELAHLRKAHEDSKRTFDQRIKDEQRHSVEAVSKAEADVRYFRNALEKLRDEVGKKESAMTRTIHDLQAELAKRDVKIDGAKLQIKSLEEDLKQQQTDSSGRSRDIAKLSSQLLSETNKSKRLEDKVRELEEEIKRQRSKQTNTVTEASRRENGLRIQLKDKDEELMRANAKLNSLERRLIAQEEELRRLSALS
ncbi:DNA-binding protein [Marinobacterium arenosum]|uniref:DNA-binding protein n=1 Tax=Marinobacterium arenosum TaxID=2862496 RepID=UPI001C9482B3|nr:DNA-binding protein [Marinobacterium arenosum]MBY4675258.1 DNA-binding protein [Marinobacterium arenosum]